MKIQFNIGDVVEYINPRPEHLFLKGNISRITKIINDNCGIILIHTTYFGNEGLYANRFKLANTTLEKRVLSKIKYLDQKFNSKQITSKK